MNAQKRPDIEPLVVRPRDARRMLANCSKTTVWRLINTGKLDSFKEGGARWITVASIRGYIERRVSGKSTSR